MNRAHERWIGRGSIDKRHVVLYAHGGLVNEAGGLQTAEKHLNWWLNNHVYPVYFAWQSGPEESLINHLVDALRGRLPFGGLGFDLVEQFDALCEKLARSSFRWMWDEMKENARAASEGIDNQKGFQWPPPSSTALEKMRSSPGGSLTVLRLAEYVKVHKPENVVVHLVGHSAGAIFHAALLQRLIEEHIRVESMTLLAPAIRVDEFERDILPHIGMSERVGRFVTFVLSEERELDDVCGHAGVDIYHKSLLYLISRALERIGERNLEVPLLGMKKWLTYDRGRTPILNEILDRGGVCIASPSRGGADSRSDSTSHGGFDDDSLTMTSVLMRMLALSKLNPENVYEPQSVGADQASSPVEAALRASGWKLAEQVGGKEGP
jgi:pimeloyl-ACP methyl ester carboxylesterase